MARQQRQRHVYVSLNDKMTAGLFTIVIRVSGNKDTMNDDEATLEIVIRRTRL